LRQFCFWKLLTSERPSRNTPTKYEYFLLRLLSGIKKSFLSNSSKRVGNDGKVLERLWQMEFYRIATSILPSAAFVSPDVGHIFGTTGMVDFYVNDMMKWVVEITREGDCPKEHVGRFTPEGL